MEVYKALKHTKHTLIIDLGYFHLYVSRSDPPFSDCSQQHPFFFFYY